MRAWPRPGVQVVAPAALGGLLVLAAAIGTGLFDGCFLQNDSAQYVSMAKNLLDGQGVATSLVWTDEQHRLGGLPVPQTNLPPGYPVLIALTSQLGGTPPGRAALVVSAVCFGLIPLVLYRILTVAGRPPIQSLALSGSWLVLPLVWFNVLACLSEMSYTLLTLLGAACLGQSERDAARRNVWLLAAGTLAGLAFTIRYAGVVYIASLGALFLVRAARRRDRPSMLALLLVCAPPAAFVLALFTRTYWLTGRLVGGLRGDEGNSIAAVLTSLYWSLSEVSGFSKSGLGRGDLAEWLLVIVVVSGFGALAAGVRPRLRWSALRAAGADPHASLAVIYIAGSLVFMIMAATAHASGVIASRYLLPLIPFGLLLMPYGLDMIQWPSRSRGRRTVVAALRGGAVAVFLAGQIEVLADQRGAVLASPYLHIDRALQQPFGAGTLHEFLGRHVTPRTPLLGNEAQLTGAVLDRPVVGLPGPFYTRTIWTEREARRVVEKYGVAYVVFFPALFDPAAPDVDNQAFFRDLKQGRVPRWLEPTFSSTSVHLYHVNGAGA